MILKLTNGTKTVDLASTVLYLKRNGYTPRVAQELTPGVFEQVTESFDCFWYDLDDDARGETLRDLHELVDQAAEVARQQRHYDVVWIEARANTEGASRFALIHNIAFTELSSQLYGPARIIGLRFEITREGVWREYPPGGGQLTNFPSATPVNKSDGSNQNWLTIADGLVDGDTNALLWMTIEATKNVTIGMKTGTTTALNGFHPNLYVGEDVLYTYDDGATVSASASIPDGEKAAFTSDGYFYWGINTPIMTGGQRLNYFRGRYAIYAYCKMTAGSGNIRYRTALAAVEHPWVRVTHTSTRMVYLGQTVLPHHGAIGLYEYNDNAYPIGVDVDDVTGGTLELYGIALVPADEIAPAVLATESTGAANESNVIDGLDRVTFKILNPAVPISFPIPPAPVLIGEFPTVPPGTTTRFFFWWHGVNYEFDFAEAAHDVIGGTVARFRGLR